MTRGMSKRSSVRSQGDVAGWKVLAALGIMIAVALTFVYLAKERFTVKREGAFYAARVMRSVDPIWGGGRGLRDGEWLQPGTLILESGAAEIEFDSGAVARLFGPTEFQVTAFDEATLAYGQVHIQLPARAQNFTVTTPYVVMTSTGVVMDLAVLRGDQTDVHVLEGKMDLARLEGPMVGRSTPVPAGVAVRVVSTNYTENGAVFAPTLPTVEWLATETGPIPFALWSFDRRVDEGWPASGEGWVPTGFVATPDSQVEGVEGGTQGGFAHFGATSLLSVEDPVVDRSQPFTVSCWLRMSPGETHFLVRHLSSERRTQEWRVGVVPRGEQVVVDVGTGNKTFVGRTDLSDGNWHHVAASFIPSGARRGVADVRCYVDAILEPLVAGSREKEPFHSVSVARLDIEAGPGIELDEVRLTGRALGPAEIAELVVGLTTE